MIYSRRSKSNLLQNLTFQHFKLNFDIIRHEISIVDTSENNATEDIESSINLNMDNIKF